MRKAALLAIAAACDLTAAVLLYQSGRVFLPLILVVGGLCFIAAAVGAAMKARRS